MFLTEVNTVAVEALRATFDSSYPDEQFRPRTVEGVVRPLWISMEYPASRASAPGIWVEFETSAPARIAGIDHKEIATDGQGHERPVRRWRFAGRFIFTCTALTTVERDLLADELFKVLASGMEHPARARFRTAVETNDLIGLQANWDEIDLTTPVAAPGTPWGTDDLFCERSLALGVQGEFVSDLSQDNAVLVPLSEVRIYHRAEGEPWPTPVAGNEGWV